jgi:hypothetical protein
MAETVLPSLSIYMGTAIAIYFYKKFHDQKLASYKVIMTFKGFSNTHIFVCTRMFEIL